MGSAEQLRSWLSRKQLARLFDGAAKRALAPVTTKLAELEDNQHRLAREQLRARAESSRDRGQPIRVIFLCHLGSMWGKVSPLFRELRSDPRFDVDVLALSYRHPSFGDDEYHDAGAAAHLRDEEGIEPIDAYDAENNHWLDLQSLEPDYLFYPTPYDSQYPPSYHTSVTKYFARLCYIPYYGIKTTRGAIVSITHPRSFYSNLTFAFTSHDGERQLALKTHDGNSGHFVAPVTGSPMFDPIFEPGSASDRAWNYPEDRDRIRILWTPRWRVEEGTCHFEDYSDFLLDFVEHHQQIDFVFRPHPLFFNNFLTQGRLSRSDITTLFARYARLPNASIDESNSYRDTFLTGDILISDVSSMLTEFLATGSPIIYTHRENTFNDFGCELASGYYWASNQQQLDQTLRNLLANLDPLRETRQALAARLLRPGIGTASSNIKEILLDRF